MSALNGPLALNPKPYANKDNIDSSSYLNRAELQGVGLPWQPSRPWRPLDAPGGGGGVGLRFWVNILASSLSSSSYEAVSGFLGML